MMKKNNWKKNFELLTYPLTNGLHCKVCGEGSKCAAWIIAMSLPTQEDCGLGTYSDIDFSVGGCWKRRENLGNC